jgi:hypothetical protein
MHAYGPMQEAYNFDLHVHEYGANINLLTQMPQNGHGRIAAFGS